MCQIASSTSWFVSTTFSGYLRKNYNRARILYATALAAMEERGPDMPLLLFSFAIFCLVTGVRSKSRNTLFLSFRVWNHS